MVNSNVPHLRSLVSASCIGIIVQVKILNPSSVRSNEHIMAPLSALWEWSDYRLVHLNSRSYNGEIVQLQSAANVHDYNTFSGKIKHVPHFRAHNWKIFPKPCACTFTSEQFRWFIQLRIRNLRCNTSPGFGAFFGHVIAIDSCSLLSRSFSLFFSFFIL